MRPGPSPDRGSGSYERMMSRLEETRSETGRWLSWASLVLLILVGAALRWRYIQEISLYIDEFVTAWAARNIPLRGLPSFPSGNIYPHGFVFTYLEAPFVLGAFDETWARIPGLLVSLVGIVVVYAVGRRFFDTRVGLIGAAALALDPDCIVWGGRARMYGLLQLLVLLVVFLYYRGLTQDRARDRYLALGLAVVAIFTHAEAGLLLPALALATVVVWPWRRALRRDVILPFVLAGVGAGVFFLISKYGQPGHLETLQESRPYLDLTAQVLTGPKVFAPFFLDGHRLPFTLLALGGLYFVVCPRLDRQAPLTYLYLVFLAVLAPLLVLAGATWQNERYLFLLLPILFLVAGAVLVRLLDLLPWARRLRAAQPAVLALAVALLVGLIGSERAYQQEWGYDRAFRYLRDEGRPQAGEPVLSVSPAACALYMGECDYFAIQSGYAEFLVSRPGDGQLVDLWTATPILTDTAHLRDLLQTSPRVWLVSDGWRFQTRYEPDFIQVVLDQMERVYDDRGVMVFRSKEAGPTAPPAVQIERPVDFGDALRLAGYDLSTSNPQPGQTLEVALHWQALEQARVGYTAFLHLVAVGDRGVAGVDEDVLSGLYQPALWPKDVTMIDRHGLPLPADLPPGRYRLDLGLYPTGAPEQLLPVGEGDRLPLADLTVGPPVEFPPPAVSLDADLGGQVRLLGYDLACSEPLTCDLELHWQALRAMDQDYTVFSQILDENDAIVAQDDGPPGDPYFPTSTWLPGARVLDARHLAGPGDAAPGDYRLVVGLYHQPTQQRLLAVDAGGQPLGDAVVLTVLSLGGTP